MKASRLDFIKCKAFVPEWSKGADLSSAIERCVGSNPTGCIFIKKNKENKIKRKNKKIFKKRKI